MSGHETPKVVMIGGTSHAGKTTLARDLATRLGADLISTDTLSRHPGRPWRDDDNLSEDVVAYFSQRSDDARAARRSFFLDDVWHHYANRVWPIAAAIVRCRLDNPYDRPLVLEGSAILPFARLPRVETRFLKIDAESLRSRLYRSSDYANRRAAQRSLIDTFLERSLDFQDRLVRAAPTAQLIDITNDASIAETIDQMDIGAAERGV